MQRDGKAAVITGGCHGIGAAVKEAFFARGYRAFTIDICQNDSFVGYPLRFLRNDPLAVC